MNEFSDERFSIKIENGILITEWYCDYIDYIFVDDGIRIRREITKGESYPMLSDIRLAKSGSREARERMSDKDAGEGINAVAILVKSKVQQIFYSFFNSVYKAPAPTKLFSDKEEALKWLEQYK